MRAIGAALLAAALSLLTACAPALREPPPVADLRGTPARAPVETPPASEVDCVLRDADAAFARRPDAAAVTAALDLYLTAARADEARVEGLLGAATASAWLIEHEPNADRRAALVTEAVQACQWCQRRAPASIDCKYRLALALGQQARDRRSTGLDAVPKIVSLLEEVIADAPLMDNAGGHRVLALLLLRAPGWPTGPGDPDAALEHARNAGELAPDRPENLLALGEALAATGSPEPARLAYTRAEELAKKLAASGDPDAREWAEAAARARKALR
jgi:tetratricopeptide (TPR) repeat protein